MPRGKPIIVEIRGGVVQEVYWLPPRWSYEVVDWDDVEEGEAEPPARRVPPNAMRLEMRGGSLVDVRSAPRGHEVVVLDWDLMEGGDLPFYFGDVQDEYRGPWPEEVRDDVEKVMAEMRGVLATKDAEARGNPRVAPGWVGLPVLQMSTKRVGYVTADDNLGRYRMLTVDMGGGETRVFELNNVGPTRFVDFAWWTGDAWRSFNDDEHDRVVEGPAPPVERKPPVEFWRETDPGREWKAKLGRYYAKIEFMVGSYFWYVYEPEEWRAGHREGVEPQAMTDDYEATLDEAKDAAERYWREDLYGAEESPTHGAARRMRT